MVVALGKTFKRVNLKVMVKVAAFSGSAGILPAGLHSPPVTSNGEAMIAMRAVRKTLVPAPGCPRSKNSLALAYRYAFGENI
jgi:hypothetical protein